MHKISNFSIDLLLKSQFLINVLYTEFHLFRLTLPLSLGTENGA